MTLLSVVHSVCDFVGVPRMSAVVGVETPDARQFLELATREAQELGRRTTWQPIVAERVFLSVASEVQTNAPINDVAWIITETFFNRSRQHRVFGPLSAEEWQQQKALTTSLGVDQFRVRDNELLLMPAPPAGETYAFEYVTVYIVRAADGVTLKAFFTADDDSFRLSERLLRLGMIWRWKQVKGLDYAEDYRTYQIGVTDLIGRESGARTLSAAREPMVPRSLVPEGSWFT